MLSSKPSSNRAVVDNNFSPTNYMKKRSYDNHYRRPHQSCNNHNYFNHNKRKFGDDIYDNRDNKYQQNYNKANSFFHS